VLWTNSTTERARRNEQEELWAARLLDEVRQEAEIPIKYVMNTLQPWMTELASRAVFIGSDGVDTEEAHLTRTILDYEGLAAHTETGRFYIARAVGAFPFLPEEAV